MDLDHVCHLHKQWFSNLRIYIWRKDYVEYRLTSHFHGLQQDILVKGAPIDDDSYWYEFIGPLAYIRVDGSMSGPDGELTLTEKITYRFLWILAPLFWLLKPLFKKQKEDILMADSQLLERMYELEIKGFQREHDSRKRVIVYGGNGFFGRLVVEDLLQHTDAQIVVASRKGMPLNFDQSTRIHSFISDANDRDSVLSTIHGATAVICCTGPYQGHSLTLLRACIEKKIHYIDVADDRDFVVRCHQLRDQIEQSGIMAFVGCSVVPGIASLLTKYAQDKIGQPEETRICISPGTRHPRGTGSFICLLNTVGEKYIVDQNSEPRTVYGWTEREQVRFPEPMGRRWVYSIVDIADYYIQPLYFGTKKTSFKIGAEIDLLNRGLSLVRWAKQTFSVAKLDWFAKMARPIILMSSAIGTTQGGVIVDVRTSKEKFQRIQWSILRAERGEIIPAFLPSLAAQMILRDELHIKGLVDLSTWLPYPRFRDELAKRDIRLATIEADNQDWSILN